MDFSFRRQTEASKKKCEPTLNLSVNLLTRLIGTFTSLAQYIFLFILNTLLPRVMHATYRTNDTVAISNIRRE